MQDMFSHLLGRDKKSDEKSSSDKRANNDTEDILRHSRSRGESDDRRKQNPDLSYSSHGGESGYSGGYSSSERSGESYEGGASQGAKPSYSSSYGERDTFSLSGKNDSSSDRYSGSSGSQPGRTRDTPGFGALNQDNDDGMSYSAPTSESYRSGDNNEGRGYSNYSSGGMGGGDQGSGGSSSHSSGFGQFDGEQSRGSYGSRDDD